MRWLASELSRTVILQPRIGWSSSPEDFVGYRHYDGHLKTATQTVGMVWDYMRDKTIQATIKRKNKGPERPEVNFKSLANGIPVRLCLRCGDEFVSGRAWCLCNNCRKCKSKEDDFEGFSR